jgi:hypothetical protein
MWTGWIVTTAMIVSKSECLDCGLISIVFIIHQVLVWTVWYFTWNKALSKKNKNKKVFRVPIITIWAQSDIPERGLARLSFSSGPSLTYSWEYFSRGPNVNSSSAQLSPYSKNPPPSSFLSTNKPPRDCPYVSLPPHGPHRVPVIQFPTFV